MVGGGLIDFEKKESLTDVLAGDYRDGLYLTEYHTDWLLHISWLDEGVIIHPGRVQDETKFGTALSTARRLEHVSRKQEVDLTAGLTQLVQLVTVNDFPVILLYALSESFN